MIKPIKLTSVLNNKIIFIINKNIPADKSAKIKIPKPKKNLNNPSIVN